MRADDPWARTTGLAPASARAGLPLDAALEAVQQCRDAADLRARLAGRVNPGTARPGTPPARG